MNRQDPKLTVLLFNERIYEDKVENREMLGII